jgi:hypothetical protein
MTYCLENLKPDVLAKGLVGRKSMRIVGAGMLGPSTIRDKRNAELQHESDHSQGGAREDMCRKDLCLRRIGSTELSFDALSNTQAAKSGESNVDQAGGIEETTMRCMNLSTLQISSTQRASFNSLVVKNEMVIAQPKAKRLETEGRGLDPSTGQIEFGFLVGSTTGSGHAPGKVVITPSGDGGSAFGGKSIDPPKPQLPSRYVASVKLDTNSASLQMSAFVEEVMSHLQPLPGAQIEMTLEMQVNTPGGIDEQTARNVLENSAALKIVRPGLY